MSNFAPFADFRMDGHVAIVTSGAQNIGEAIAIFVCLNLSRAFVNFLEKRSQFPRFISKHGKQSLAHPQNVKLGNDYLKFPKLGETYAKIHRSVEGKVKTVTITKNKANQYYASVLFEDGKKLPEQSTKGKAIVRYWQCPSCGTKHDRDINADLIIRDEGWQIMTSGTEDKAYYPDVRRDSRGRKKSTK